MNNPIWKLLPILPTQSVQVVLRKWPDGRQESVLVTSDEYLKWLDAGNEPLPADIPSESKPDPKMVGIEFDGVMCSATRDDQNGLVAVIIAHQLQKATFQPTVFRFVNGNTLLMTFDNLPKFLAVWMPFRQSFFKPEDKNV